MVLLHAAAPQVREAHLHVVVQYVVVGHLLLEKLWLNTGKLCQLCHLQQSVTCRGRGGDNGKSGPSRAHKKVLTINRVHP